MRPAVGRWRSQLAYPPALEYSQAIPKKQTWEWDCVMQCGNGSTNLYVIFLVSLRRALNSFLATTILSLRNLSYSSSLLCEYGECDTEQNTTASLRSLLATANLGLDYNCIIDYSKLGNTLQELLEKKDWRWKTEMCSHTWSGSPKFLYRGPSLINLWAFFHGI